MEQKINYTTFRIIISHSFKEKFSTIICFQTKNLFGVGISNATPCSAGNTIEETPKH